MGAENHKETRKRIRRDLRRIRNHTHRIEAQQRAVLDECAQLVEQARLASEQLAAMVILAEQTNAALLAVMTALRSTVANSAPLPDAHDATAAPEQPARFEQLLIAQQRTNELLELALGVAFDAELE
jgi:hypothetical protein